MTDLADLTAAPVGVTIGGKDWELSPLTIGDYGKLQRAAVDWVTSDARRRAEAERQLSPAGTIDAGAGVLTEARDVIRNDQADGRYVSSPDGRCHVIALSLAHRHPDVTPEAVGGLVPFFQAADLVLKVYALSMGRNASDAAVEGVGPNDQSPAATAATGPAAAGSVGSAM